MTQLDHDRVESVYLDEHGGLRIWGKTNYSQLVAQVAYTETSFREHLYALLRNEGWESRDLANMQVLEIGCGWGRNFPIFMDIGIAEQKIHGVDLLQPFVEKARQLFPSAAVLQGDTSKIQEFGKQFDLILIHTVLSAVLDETIHKQIVKEATSCLSSGGLLVVMDIVEHYKEGQVMVNGKLITFIRPVQRRSVQSYAHDEGLSLVCNREFGLMPRLRSAIYTKLGRVVLHPIALRLLSDFISLIVRSRSHYLMVFKKN